MLVASPTATEAIYDKLDVLLGRIRASLGLSISLPIETAENAVVQAERISSTTLYQAMALEREQSHRLREESRALIGKARCTQQRSATLRRAVEMRRELKKRCLPAE